MKQRFAAMVVLMFLFSLSALADQITFTTSGSFNGATTYSSPVSVDIGGGGSVRQGTNYDWTLKFTGVSFSATTPPYDIFDVDAGTFTLSCLGPGCTGAASHSFLGSFDLHILQSDPSSGVGNIIGDLTGTVKTTTGNNGDQALITFQAPTSVTIGTVTYSITANDVSILFDQGGTSQTEHVAVNISELPPTPPTRVPEPASLGLMGAGLLGLSWVLRRRIR